MSTSLGSSKKGRSADSSMVTRNVRIVAQGQADATYADQQKKNGFRPSTAILSGGGSYSAQTLVRQVIQDAVTPALEPEPESEPPPGVVDLFSPFNVADWRLNNGYSSESTNPVGITMMTASPFVPNPGSPRSSSFYRKYRLDLTRSFFINAKFLTRTAGNPPLDGFTVAISTNPLTFGGNGGNLGIAGSSSGIPATSYPVVAVALKPFNVNNTFLLTANTTGTPTGSPITLGGIGTDITTVNNLETIVFIGYYPFNNTLTYSITNNKPGSVPVANIYTNVDLPALFGGVNRGYIGCSAGAGGKIQPVFLTGMTYNQV